MANSRNEPPSGIRSPTKDDSRKGEEVVRDEDDDSDDPYAAFTEWADEIDAVWDDWPMPTAP